MLQNSSARAPWGGVARITMPIVLAGAIVAGVGITTPADAAAAAPKRTPRAKAPAPAPSRVVAAPVAVRPAATPAPAVTSYRVVKGDTVAAIAARFGSSTASVLAANGLGWRSLIFPGQVLRIPGAAPTAAPAAAPAPTPAPAPIAGRYTVVRGDTVSGIAAKTGSTTAAVLAANGMTAATVIYPGQSLVVPGSAPVAPPATPPAATPAPTPPPTATAASGSYVIRSGDTISRIAAAHGVSTAALLAANGLVPSSIIYAGRALTIPGAVAAPVLVPASNVTPVQQPATGVTPLTPQMAANARAIVQVGRQLGVPDRGIVIALATAMQESGLRNLPNGHLDSVGLFQQRPSYGWGTPQQLSDPAQAALRFYGGPSNPNRGVTRGLLDIRGWQSMTLTQAAQAVQISAYPNAYARWETSATAWLPQLG